MDPNQDQGNQVETTQPLETTQETQEAPMPSADQQTEEVSKPEAGEESGLELPEGVSERTAKQFEKLKAELAEAKRLAKANSQKNSYGTSVLDSFRSETPQQQNQPFIDSASYGNLNATQVNAITEQYVDADGNVDINGLNQALSKANSYAEQALQRAQQAEEKLTRFEETQQVREAHAVFPEIDPQSDSFNPDFFEAVRDRLLRSNFYEGKNLTILQAANAVKKAFGQTTKAPNLDKVKTEAVQQYKETQKARQQGPVESGRGESRQTTSTIEELRERTRRGDNDAITERLKNVGVIKD